MRNKYVLLLSGRCDRAILKNVEAGKDFTPSEWDVTRTTKEE